MLASFFVTAFFMLCVCTVVINNLESGMALLTGFLIVINNFGHVLVLNSVYLMLQILIMGALGNILFGIVVIVPFTVTMTLAYQVFVVKDSYFALSNIQPTA